MPRLPQVGGDTGNWGDILNDYLSQSLASDGSIKAGAVSSAALDSSLQTSLSRADNGFNVRGDWQQSTDYSADDLIFAAGHAWRCLVSHTSGTGFDGMQGGNWQSLAGGLFVNVRDYGAVGDGVVDDTTAFTAALAAAAAVTLSGSSTTVFAPSGTYLIDPLVLPNRVSLFGAGPGATRLRRRSVGTTTGPFVKNDTNARLCSVRDLMLDGMNVGDATSHGLSLDNSTALDTDVGNGISEYVDGRHFVSDILIQNCMGNGLHMTGRGVTMITRVQSWLNACHGFRVGTDSFLSDCDAGVSGWDGFYIAGANTRIVSCKAWYSGNVSTAAAGVIGGTGHGFHFADGNWSTCAVSACEAQDNARSGFYLNNVGRHIVTGCTADSNNTAGLNHAGFEVINAGSCSVQGIGWDRDQSVNHQLSALRIQGAGSNRIEITASNSNGNMPQPYITDDSLPDGNVVQINSQNGFRSLAYSANITPNPYNGKFQSLVLTGNLTVEAPIYKHAGAQMTFIFTQDATGSRTVTWDSSGYVLTDYLINPEPNATTTSDFIYSGTKWVQTSCSYRPVSTTRVTKPMVGEFITSALTGTSTTTTIATLNEMCFMPVDVEATTRVDAISCYVQSAGAGAGIALRLGLYADNGYNRPGGAPVVDAGTVNPTTTGSKIAAFTAVSLSPGRYWMGVVAQGAITTGPTLQAAQLIVPITFQGVNTNNHRTWAHGAVSGVLGSIGSVYQIGSNPWLALRVSA